MMCTRSYPVCSQTSSMSERRRAATSVMSSVNGE